jgi:hypothetical protein
MQMRGGLSDDPTTANRDRLGRHEFDRREQCVRIIAADVAHAVDEEGRRNGDAEGGAGDEIVDHAPPMRPFGELARTAPGVNPDLGGRSRCQPRKDVTS